MVPPPTNNPVIPPNIPAPTTTATPASAAAPTTNHPTIAGPAATKLHHAPPPPPTIAPTVADSNRLMFMASSLSSEYELDVSAQEQLLWLAQDFVDKVICQSMKLAQHANQPHVQVQDVALILKKYWNLQIPSLSPVSTNDPHSAGRVLASGARPGSGPRQKRAKTTK